MSTSHPNLLFIFPDEFRKHAIAGLEGFFPGLVDPVHTPNLDALIEQSLVLSQAVSTNPVCSPYRAMMLTGQYPWQTGVHTNVNSVRAEEGNPDKQNYLKADMVCFSDVLAANGYDCGYIGKYHLDPPASVESGGAGFIGPSYYGGTWDAYNKPERRHGFNYWYSYGCYDNHMQPRYWSSADEGPLNYKTLDRWSPVEEADRAIGYLHNTHGQRDPDKPFALFISMNPPHMPFTGPESHPPNCAGGFYDGKSDRDLLNRPNVIGDLQGARGYFEMVTGVDAQVGRIINALDADPDLKARTILVFTSDHGEMMHSHGRIGKNVIYEESYGVPFIIRWPDQIQPGQNDILLGTTDIMPTFLSLMGLTEQIPAGVRGTDYSAALLGQPGPRPLSAPYFRNSGLGQDTDERGVKTERYSFCTNRQGEAFLFDNQEDIYQLLNLALDPGFRELVQDLKNRTQWWIDYMGDEDFVIEGTDVGEVEDQRGV